MNEIVITLKFFARTSIIKRPQSTFLQLMVYSFYSTFM